MDSLKSKEQELTKKIFHSRLRMLSRHPFFGVLALDMKYHLNTEEKTFSTDGKRIRFNPRFLELLSSEELDICILHAIMHTILKHPFKENEYDNKEIYHLACDIVVNSNILYSAGVNKELYVLGQKLPHLTPDGKEGYLCTTREVYEMLLKNQEGKESNNSKPIITYTTNYSGTLYSRLFSVKNYMGNGNWEDSPRLNDVYSNDPLNFTNIKFNLLNQKIYKIEYNNKNKEETLPIPSYCDNYASSSFDGFPLKTNNKKESYYFCYKKTSPKLLKQLSEIDFPEDIAKEEKKYREFVRNNYLGITPELQAFFDRISYINNFKKEDSDIINKVARYVSKCARYSLIYPKCPKDRDYIIHFMSESKIGKCTHFASSSVMFYRSLGIPARYVVGYSTSAKANKVNNITDDDAHAWVEVYIDNIGWIVVESTASVGGSNGDGNEGEQGLVDSHDSWEENDSEESKDREREIDSKVLEANQLNESRNPGNVPAFVTIMINKMTKPQIDWRVYLASFIQETIVDYSFCPPDKRFSDSDFLLPSFSEPDEEVKDILFMVDVSGSMSNDDIVQCFSEIQSAILQFNGKLQGYVGFFDYDVKEVKEFDGDTNILDIKPYGRGGTNFFNVFKYIKENMSDKLPTSIIILSDGYAEFPDIKESLGIPVLWVINNDKVTPPWGNVTRLISDN